MKKVTINRPDGVGILTLADDGKWDITLNGKAAPSNLHYTTVQVEKIITDMTARGYAVTID